MTDETKQSNTDLPTGYDFASVEANIYKIWLDSGYFTPENLPLRHAQGKPYTIVMPPPNVTGTLHVGHALGMTIEDILIRFERMRGRKTLWLPGTDHAAIATQSKVEKILEKEEGKKKRDLGREAFLARVEAFAKDSHDTIVSQIEALGASCDWSREAYTLDDARNIAVRTAFKNMYDAGLIYRGDRVINWDVKGQTTISDDEIVYEPRKAKLYTFKYSKDFPISISTTRPETKVGDTAVAVHPDDSRYQEFVGKEYDLEFAGVPLHLKIIADKEAEKEFGTGALGVTPAHSSVDYELAQNHNLPLKQVIDEHGRMINTNTDLDGKKVLEARDAVVEWLKTEGLLLGEEEINQNVATAERTGGIIEPLPKLQWFIDVNKEFTLPHSEIEGIKSGQTVTLKKLMRHVVETGQIKITPSHFEKTYFHWIENLRDWCISRQIWFGHRVPVWYRPKAGQPGAGEEIYCDVQQPEGNGWEQDPDTLDTWFSSGLWTFSTLGWPHSAIPLRQGYAGQEASRGTPTDFEIYHPTDVLETGYDILFFWVSRMILMTTFHTGQIPFRNVFLHGLVRDADKKKMSKSKGNIIDPLDMIAKYGADALRFALVFNTAPGTDMALAEDKIKGMKHFANKLWNVSRFVISNLEGTDTQPSTLNPQPSSQADKDILEKLEKLTVDATKHIEEFRLHEATQALYDFVWHELADVYIEKSKEQINNEATKQNTLVILLYCLIAILKLLHPFMPFVTEHIWSLLKQRGLIEKVDLLIIEQWPEK